MGDERRKPTIAGLAKEISGAKLDAPRYDVNHDAPRAAAKLDAMRAAVKSGHSASRVAFAGCPAPGAVAEAAAEAVEAMGGDLPKPELDADGLAKEQSVGREALRDRIGSELWEALAYDLALKSAPDDEIARGYGLTAAGFAALRKNRYFAKLTLAKAEEVEGLGADASFQVKMRMVANKATPMLLRRLLDDSTSAKDFQSLYRTVVELAKLLPKEDPLPAVSGPTVTFNISGVPGLEHLGADCATPAVETTAERVELSAIEDELADLGKFEAE